jgi:hypothetical protein
MLWRVSDECGVFPCVFCLAVVVCMCVFFFFHLFFCFFCTCMCMIYSRAPCDPSTNKACAEKVFGWGGNTWKLWSTCSMCSVASLSSLCVSLLPPLSLSLSLSLSVCLSVSLWLYTSLFFRVSFLGPSPIFSLYYRHLRCMRQQVNNLQPMAV